MSRSRYLLLTGGYTTLAQATKRSYKRRRDELANKPPLPVAQDEWRPECAKCHRITNRYPRGAIPTSWRVIDGEIHCAKCAAITQQHDDRGT